MPLDTHYSQTTTFKGSIYEYTIFPLWTLEGFRLFISILIKEKKRKKKKKHLACF